MKRKINFVLLFGILMTISITSQAQLSMIKDLQTTVNTAGSNPNSFFVANGVLYFVADDPSTGNELWRTDGTTTQLVKDIKTGSGSSFPINLPVNFVVYRDTLYFQADDGLYGKELWKSDGTDGGTEMVSDIYSGSSGHGGINSSSPQNFIVYKDSLYFQARDNNGAELWKTDGSESGTRMVKDIYTGSSGGGANSSNPQNFVIVNNILFFVATNKNTGPELWKSDGTAAGTMMVKDINPGTKTTDPPPRLFTGIDSILYFAANDGTHGEELWRSNGTASGTYMVKDILTGSAGSTIDKMISWGKKIYFSADDGTDGVELWKSDGTAAGTVLINDLNTGNSPSYPDYLTLFNGALYFAANDGFSGFELYKTDGINITQVKDILPGTGASSSPNLLTICNNTLYFGAQTTNGNELWKSDGTLAGTVLVKDIWPGSTSSNPRDLTAFNNKIYFGAETASSGREPWVSDGTTTVMLKDIVTGTESSKPSELTNINGTTLFFSATSTANGNELFKTDGTAAGTVLVKDLLPGDNGKTPPTPNSSNPKHLINVNNILFFTTNIGNGYELWTSDGTSTGTKIVKPINSGVGSDPDSFCAIGSTLYFTANDGTHGFELWKSNGTATGTVMVKDIDTSHKAGIANSSNPFGLTNINGKLFFRAEDGVNGTELWTSDGTANGTVMVKDINPGAGKSSYPMNLYSYKNLCFFQADDGTNGIELWKSDGTATGTIMVKDIYPGSFGFWGANSSSPQYFTELNGYLYFQATSSVGRELWKTDGTDTGTKIVKDIYPGSGYGGAYSSSPTYLTKVGNNIFFAATTPAGGTELWKTDGTTAGTVIVKNINPVAKASSNPNNLYAIGNILYFVASDGVHGPELWKVENNQCGKVAMTGEINPGNGGAGPTYLANIGTLLLFSASTKDYGSELWKYNNILTYSDTANLSYSICNGDSVKMHNKFYKTTGTFRDSLKTSLGCDSLILMKLTVNLKYHNNTVVQKCIGDSVLIQGVWRKNAGTFTDSLKTIKGCDSILDVTLSFSAKPPRPVITIIPTITLHSSSATGNQWYDNNGPIVGQTGQTYATTNGTKKYYVIVTINGCSSDPSNSANPQLGSIDNDYLSNLNIYPNPVSDKLIIEFKGNQKAGYRYYINNMEGQALITGKLTETKNVIDISTVPKGIYFVKIIFEDQVGLIKIIKD